MQFIEEYDYDSGNDYDEFSELSPEIQTEIENDRRFNIVIFYKEKLYHEPEFIGINNISSALILYIIDTTHIACKLNTKDHRLTNNQICIFDNMYIELFGNKSNINIYNTVTKKIFEKIYIN